MVQASEERKSAQQAQTLSNVADEEQKCIPPVKHENLLFLDKILEDKVVVANKNSDFVVKDVDSSLRIHKYNECVQIDGQRIFGLGTFLPKHFKIFAMGEDYEFYEERQISGFREGGLMNTSLCSVNGQYVFCIGGKSGNARQDGCEFFSSCHRYDINNNTW